MDRQKRHTERAYHLVGVPEQGALDGGYLQYSADTRDAASILTQKRRIQEHAECRATQPTELVVQALPAREEA
jgi:hypothetical protein